jgi:hypothetical protein
MPMNNRLLRPLQTPGLLDLVPGAAAAYSLRSLSRSYAGPVVTVRRSSDDAEEDFTAAEVADGTLAAFCGAGDGFVKQWWDQSGNARHAVSPADANEPQIVNAGSVILKEGKPAIRYDGTDDALFYQNTDIQSLIWSVFCVASCDSTSTVWDMVYSVNDGATDSGVSQTFNDGTLGVIDGAGWYPTVATITFAFQKTGVPAGSQVLTALIANVASSGAFYADGAVVPSGGFGRRSGGENGITIGFQTIASPARNLDGTIQELIVYPSDLTAQRELIEGNIAWSYSQ